MIQEMATTPPDAAGTRRCWTSPRRRRMRILAEVQQCQYCGIPLNEKNSSLDHFTPRSKGGGNRRENLILCCVPCNQSKNDRTPEEWIEYLRRCADSVSEMLKKQEVEA